MFKIIVVVIVVLIAGVLAFASMKPDRFRTERSIRIKAPPEKIFPMIDDLHAWTTWSPYEKKDPALKRTFSGAASGRGAKYAWEGNKEVGQGSMEITGSTPSSLVAMDLHFLKPFEANNKVEFTLVPDGDSTRVTWAIFGPMPFVSKIMCVFFNMDKMIGTDFEVGLASLKAMMEKP